MPKHKKEETLMASLYRKPCAETMIEDGNSGYQSNGLWNKYAERLDACDFFAGCGKKNGAVDFCAIAYCYWLFVNIICDDHEPTEDERKWATHWFMYQRDDCCTSAGCMQQAQVYKDNGAWFTNPQDLVVGDQIFFQRWDDDAGRYVYYHTGGCCDWDDSGVYVTEANTNGGKTQIKFYPYSEFGNKIGGFGHPRFDGYELVVNPQPEPQPQPEPTPTPEPEPTGNEINDDYAGSWRTDAPNGLRLRESAGDGAIITLMPYQSEVIATGEYTTIDDTVWLFVSFYGIKGWCSREWLTSHRPANPDDYSEYAGAYEIVAKSGLYLRTGAGTDNQEIMCMSYGSKCSCNGEYEIVDDTIWLKVNQYGKIGWCSSDWLRKI